MAAELALVEPYARHWRRIVVQRRRSRLGLPLGLTLPPLRVTALPRATPAPASALMAPKRFNPLIQSSGSPSLTGEPLIKSLHSSSAAPTIVQLGIWQRLQPSDGVVMAEAEDGSAVRSHQIANSPVSVVLGSTPSGISSSLTDQRLLEEIISGSGRGSLEFSRGRSPLFRQSHSQACHITPQWQHQPDTSVSTVLLTAHENHIKETVVPAAQKQSDVLPGMMNVLGVLGGSTGESSALYPMMQSGVTRRQRPTPRRPSFI